MTEEEKREKILSTIVEWAKVHKIEIRDNEPVYDLLWRIMEIIKG